MNYYDVHGYLSNSQLNEFYEHLTNKKKVDVSEERQTEIFAEGNLLDYLITEPEKVNLKTFSFDDGRQKIAFSEAIFYQYLKMRDAFLNDSFCQTIMQVSTPQKEFYRTIKVDYQGYKFKCKFKCKLDLYHPNYSADIKSTVAGNEKSFINAIELFKYYQQGALYTDVSRCNGLFFIGVSKPKSKFENPKVFKYLIDKAGATDKNGFYQRGKSRYSYLSFYHQLLLSNELLPPHKG